MKTTEQKLEIAVEALKEVGSEDCTYVDCVIDRYVPGGTSCPRDTDGDGNCGQKLCPFCSPMIELHFDPECPGEVCTVRRTLNGIGEN